MDFTIPTFADLETYVFQHRSASLSSTSSDLSWDNSPCQYDLSQSPPANVTAPNISPIPASTPFPNTERTPILPFTRTRLFASSHNPLSRTPAFRRQRSDQAFLSTPEDNPLLPLAPPPPRKSRIPTPVSPSKIVLQDVNDFSIVLPQVDLPRRSSRIAERSTHMDRQLQASQSPTLHGERGRKKQQTFRKH